MKLKHQFEEFNKLYRNIAENIAKTGGVPMKPVKFVPPPIKWYKSPRQSEPSIDRARYGLEKRIEEAIKYNFLWIWRFLFVWGWNGKKNTFSVSFWEEDMEHCIWILGDY